MNIEEISRILDEKAITCDDWFSLGNALNSLDDSKKIILQDFIFAFNYMIVSPSNSDYNEQIGPLSPMIFMDGGAFPPPVFMIEENTVKNWDGVLEFSSNPLICSRLSDLLWIRKWGLNSYMYAQKAIDYYLELSYGILKKSEIPASLRRALDLCNEIDDKQRKEIVLDRVISLCQIELENSKPSVGAIFDFLHILMSQPIKEIPMITESLLDDSLALNLNDPNLLEVLITHKIKLNPSDRKPQLTKNRIQIWIDEAEKNIKNGFIRHANLLHALALARDSGNNSLVEEIKLKIQETSEESLNFKEISVNVNIPKEKIDKLVDSYKNTKGWEEALTKFGGNLPPTGDYQNNIEQVNQQIKNYPLQFLVHTIVYDKFNFPIIESNNIESSKEIALVQNETYIIGLYAQFSPKILNVICETHGLPDIEFFTKYFSTDLISDELSNVIASSIIWYFKGEYDVSAHLLIPVLESIIRRMVKELGLAIYQEPNGFRPSGVYQLGRLLGQLKDRMNESWRRYFKNVLTEPLSLNLRNNVCHGLLLHLSKEEASLLIQLVCHLRLQKIAMIPVPIDKSD